MTRIAKPRAIRVRCLGPGKEHSFMSRDRVRERVCEPCRKKMAGYGVMVRDGVKRGESWE